MHYSNERLNGPVKMKKINCNLHNFTLQSFYRILINYTWFKRIRYALFVRDLAWLTPFLPLCVSTCNWFAGRRGLFIMDFGPVVVPPNKTHFK